MSDMSKHRHTITIADPGGILQSIAGAAHPRSRGFRALRTAVIALAILLSPLFLADMFYTVAGLLRPDMSYWAYDVPAATEGSFAILFLLDLLLLVAQKPQAWLRYSPFAFFVMSLTMNVWAGHGHPLPMIGHGAVTLAFFVPVIAIEQAIRSLSVSEQSMRRREEMKAAMQHARDLVGSYAGWRRWRVPSLLRTQIHHGRPPAAVVAAVHEGADSGTGQVAWEQAVEDWVTVAMTRNARLAARITAERHAIAAASATPQDTPAGQDSFTPQDTPMARQAKRQPAGQRARQAPASDVERRRATARRLMATKPHMTQQQIAAETGLSVRTLSRIKAEKSQLHAAG